MKNILFAFATLALIGATQAEAADTETKHNGGIRLRMINHSNAGLQVTGSTSSSSWNQRTDLGTTFSKGEDLSGHVGLIHSTVWGDGAGVGANAGDVGTGTASSSQLWVNEAWGWWKASDSFAVKMGRFGVEIGDGTVIAREDWQQTPNSFEGINGTFYTDFADFGLYGMKNDEASASATSDYAETNWYGLNIDVKNLPEALNMVNVHILQVHTIRGQFNNRRNDSRYGLTLGGNFNAFDYRFTYHAVDGKDTTSPSTDVKYASNFMDGEAGFTFRDFMNARLHVLYHSDSGDKDTTDATKNEDYQRFYEDQHANAGMMDVVKWGNSTYYNVGFALEPMDSLSVSLDYFAFSRTKKGTDESATANVGNINASGADTDATSGDVGSEIDLAVVKSYDSGMTWGLHYGIFDPGDFISKKGKNYTQWYLEGKMSF